MSENTLFAFTDVDGDLLAAFTADIPDVGKGVNVRTTEDGCSLPNADAVKLAIAILRKVVGEVYESPEELAAEIARLREESARAYSQGVENMRAAAMKAASDAPGTPYTPTEAIRDVTLTGTSEDTPAPRDGELAQQLRPIVKRYGGPNVAYEAARQSGQRL